MNKLFSFQQPDLSDIKVPPKEKKLKGYYNIARHYGWALNYTFNTLNYENVLIVEGKENTYDVYFILTLLMLPYIYIV